MERIVLVYCALLICSFLICVQTELNNDERAINNFGKRKPSSLWFGPRLGRKKRNQSVDDSYIPSPLECEELEEYSKIFPCTLIAKCRINEDKREDKNKSKQFIPRLGRDSGEELTSGTSSGVPEKWLQNSDLIGEMMIQRPQYSPRLGRRANPFGIKLGRDNELFTF